MAKETENAVNELEGKTIMISSTNVYYVYPDLSYYDKTNRNDSNPDKIKIKPNWTRKEVMIRVGNHPYPAILSQWSSVKDLANSNKIVISAVSQKQSEEATKIEQTLEKAEKDIKRRSRQFKSLSEAAKTEKAE